MFAQKFDYNWYFPYKCAITFNNPNIEPAPLFDSKLNEYGAGPSTISDKDGNLLFYCGASFKDPTDMFRKFDIFDRTHTKILRADDIFCAFHSFLINYPGKKNLLMCITSPFFRRDSWRKGNVDAPLRFDLIDVTKRNGLGEIVKTFYWDDASGTSFFIDGIFKHSNNIDWWLVGPCFEVLSPVFYFKSYLFTNKGITDSTVSYLSLPSEFDVISDVGSFVSYIPTTSDADGAGSGLILIPMKSREVIRHNLIPVGEMRLGPIEGHLGLLKFNSSTGKLSFVGHFKVCDTCFIQYPIFSPEKRKIYVGVTKKRPTSVYGLGIFIQELYQFTYSTDFKEIEQSKSKVGPTKVDYFVYEVFPDIPPPTDPDGEQPIWFSQMKIGPNGKIYILHYKGNYISEISNPEADAKDIVYKDTAVLLGDAKALCFPWTMSNGYNLWLELASNSPLCAGDSLRLSVTLSDSTKKPKKILWEGPNGFKSDKQSPTLLARQSGFYKATVYVSGTEITDSIWVDVGNSIPPKILAPKQFCRGDTIEIKVDKKYTSYFWSTGDTTKNIKVWETGRYFVRVIDSIGCNGYDTVFIEAIDVPAKIFGEKTICRGSSTVLEAFPKGSQYRYRWSTGDTSNQIKVNREGLYWVVVTDSFGCMGIDSVEVKELPNLEFTIQGDSVLCSGEFVELSAPLRGGNYTYFWSTGETSEQIKIYKGGRYWLWIRDKNGCEGYDTIDVKEYSKPEAKIMCENGRNILCKGEKLKLTAEPIGDYRYFWSNGATSPEIEITQGGTYWLLVENKYGCRDSAWIEIIERETPAPKILGDTAICIGKDGKLWVEGNYVSYLWSTGATTSSIRVNSAGIYWVEITDTNGCRARAEQKVDVFKIDISGIEPIDFGRVLVNSAVSKQVTIENHSNTRIRIKEIKFKRGTSVFEIKASTPIELGEGEATSFELIYTAVGKLEARDTIVIFVELPCQQEFEIPVVSKIEGIKTFVWLPDTTGVIGTKGYCIPLRARSDGVEIEDLSYEATIRFDATALYPENKDLPIENGERIVGLTGKGIKIGRDEATIGSFCGEVLLARLQRVPLRIDTFEWKMEGLETQKRDGSLTVTGVCLPSTSQIEMFQPTEITIIPNPVEEEIEITVRGVSGSSYLMEITNALGTTLQRVSIKIEGNETKLKMQTKDYPSGVYFVRVGGKIARFLKM